MIHLFALTEQIQVVFTLVCEVVGGFKCAAVLEQLLNKRMIQSINVCFSVSFEPMLILRYLWRK